LILNYRHCFLAYLQLRRYLDYFVTSEQALPRDSTHFLLATSFHEPIQLTDSVADPALTVAALLATFRFAFDLFYLPFTHSSNAPNRARISSI
jgi:hypothetical protein